MVLQGVPFCLGGPLVMTTMSFVVQMGHKEIKENK